MVNSVLTSGIRATRDLLDNAQSNAIRLSDPNATYTKSSAATASINGETTGLNIIPPAGYVNDALTQSIRDSLSVLGYNETIESNLKYLQPLLGQINSNSSFSGLFSRFQSLLSTFATTPDDLNVKNQLVYATQQLTTQFNQLEAQIQNIRKSCEDSIGVEVDNLKLNLNIVIDRNAKIANALNTNQTISNFEDERRGALKEIASALAINVTKNVDKSVNVCGPGGRNLIPGQVLSSISFAQSAEMDAALVYPDTLKGLMINNIDVTSYISNSNPSNTLNQAKIPALFQLRDIILPNLSQNLNQFALNLKESINAIHNNGSGYPGIPSLTGTKNVLAADTFFGTGTARIATLNNQGIIQNFVDVDLAAQPNVQAVINTINAGLGANATASIANGTLKIVGNNGLNISINENTSKMLDAAVQVSLYDTNGTLIGPYNINPGVSLANTVTLLNGQLGANAVARIDTNNPDNINILALNDNKISLNGFPPMTGTTIRSKGLSNYFGLNNFFVNFGGTLGPADAISPLNPSIAGSIQLNPALSANSNLMSTSFLDLTAGNNQPGVTPAGIPNPNGKKPAELMRDVMAASMLFHGTGNLSEQTISISNFSASLISNTSISITSASVASKSCAATSTATELEFQQKSRLSMTEITIIIAELTQAMNTLSGIVHLDNKINEKLINAF